MIIEMFASAAAASFDPAAATEAYLATLKGAPRKVARPFRGRILVAAAGGARHDHPSGKTRIGMAMDWKAANMAK